MLIIAQRINTIVNADQIIVLKDGCIQGLGTHRELMRTCAAYQEIARSQLRAEELEELMGAGVNGGASSGGDVSDKTAGVQASASEARAVKGGE